MKDGKTMRIPGLRVEGLRFKARLCPMLEGERVVFFQVDPADEPAAVVAHGFDR